MLSSEFRDGNVPAGHEQLRVLKESLRHLPERREESGCVDAAAIGRNCCSIAARGKIRVSA